MASYRVTVQDLAMRDGPSTNHRVLVSLPRHKILDQFDASPNGDWGKVRTTLEEVTIEGWVPFESVVPEPISVELTAEAPWLVVAEREMGVASTLGPEDNPRIVAYLDSTQGSESHDGIAWCSAFVNWCMKQVGIPGTDHRRARSWLEWGVPLPEPRQGCIVVLKRYVPDDPHAGHVGFYVATKTSGSFALLGGNQSKKVTISGFPNEDVLGCRWRA
jgi:uncharacterized protein (TIGR02594 family)